MKWHNWTVCIAWKWSWDCGKPFYGLSCDLHTAAHIQSQIKTKEKARGLQMYRSASVGVGVSIECSWEGQKGNSRPQVQITNSHRRWCSAAECTPGVSAARMRASVIWMNQLMTCNETSMEESRLRPGLRSVRQKRLPGMKHQHGFIKKRGSFHKMIIAQLMWIKDKAGAAKRENWAITVYSLWLHHYRVSYHHLTSLGRRDFTLLKWKPGPILGAPQIKLNKYSFWRENLSSVFIAAGRHKTKKFGPTVNIVQWLIRSEGTTTSKQVQGNFIIPSGKFFPPSVIKPGHCG